VKANLIFLFCWAIYYIGLLCVFLWLEGRNVKLSAQTWRVQILARLAAFAPMFALMIYFAKPG
jgi:hypothetical protein